MDAAVNMPDDTVLYKALASRDARLDGDVFYGITSTGIYCRPVCPSRTPKISNCKFFRSAAAAQEAGFRPCLRCRPETAPRSAAWRGTSNTVTRALQLIEEGALDGEGASVDTLAERVGVGERQLRRLFLQQLGVSPTSVAGTRRVLFAKQLLHDTRLPVAAVADAAGFGSERRMREVFQEVFGRPPLAVRKVETTDRAETGEESERVVLRVRYRGLYAWDVMLAELHGRCVRGVDAVRDGAYVRRLRKGTVKGSLHVSHDAARRSLLVRVNWPELRELPAILSCVRRLFDTDADMERIEEQLSRERILAPLIRAMPGVRVAGEWALSSEPWFLQQDGFPVESAEMLERVRGLDPAVKTAAALRQRAGFWRPWRAYAAMWLRCSGETR